MRTLMFSLSCYCHLGLTATLACFPLDVTRTRLLAKGSGPRYGGPFQTIQGIVRHEGVGALYAGTWLV